MKPGWYILNYHNVSWVSSPFLEAVGGTIAPDTLHRNLEHLGRLGDLISTDQGLERLDQGHSFDRACFSVWFDDGYAGVRTYALPVCRRFGIRGAIAVCARFAQRQEMFWRAAVSCLYYAGQLGVLRARLETAGYRLPPRIRGWLLANFSEELARIIQDTYLELVPRQLQIEGEALFETPEGIRALAKEGWVISNHSLAHYPKPQNAAPSWSIEQFELAEPFCRQVGSRDKLWVLPFDEPGWANPIPPSCDATVVRVQSRLNLATPNLSREIFRYPARWQDRSSVFTWRN